MVKLESILKHPPKWLGQNSRVRCYLWNLRFILIGLLLLLPVTGFIVPYSLRKLIGPIYNEQYWYPEELLSEKYLPHLYLLLISTVWGYFIQAIFSPRIVKKAIQHLFIICLCMGIFFLIALPTYFQRTGPGRFYFDTRLTQVLEISREFKDKTGTYPCNYSQLVEWSQKHLPEKQFDLVNPPEANPQSRGSHCFSTPVASYCTDEGVLWTSVSYPSLENCGWHRSRDRWPLMCQIGLGAQEGKSNLIHRNCNQFERGIPSFITPTIRKLPLVPVRETIQVLNSRVDSRLNRN